MKSLEASSSKIITILTDFGLKDPFVGQMKGVILSINPHVRIVDITHEIEPQSVEDAAFVLYESFQYFPEGSIHIAVVDPEVGSQRKALIVKSQGHYFVAPDNGILSYILKEPFYAVSIENEKYFLRKSPTFQGRDVFAPAAAWLSKGIEINEFGGPAKDIKVFKTLYDIQGFDDKIVGKIVYIDRFGNAITNIKPEGKKIRQIKINELILPVVSFYSQYPHKPAAVINSDGFIEIFIYMGNAKKTLSLEKKQTVEAFLDG
ncbi:SAM-dependent chlorinase/fluorinase [Thermodesulfovibrio sp. 3907-1M]|uniref:SAM-dependent chlorinase/fluorinase n=1 Tax=Thermodesulfovibrio autotrophicus TaxID=3118333 RepID=A0AAU8GYG8_9BACT